MATKNNNRVNANGGSRSLHAGVMPRTPEEWAAYRCKLSCRIGRDALEGKTQTPVGITRLEYAVYNLLHAVEELARLNDQAQRPLADSDAGRKGKRETT